MLRSRAEKLLTRLSGVVNLAEGLTAPKSLRLKPWGGVLLLNPDGEWQIFTPGEWPAANTTDVVICWQPEQWAKWMQGALAGWWSVSLKDGISIEGDVAWAMGLYQRLQMLPWWYNHQLQHASTPSLFSFMHRVGQKAFSDVKTLLSASAVLIEDGLKESGLGLPRPMIIGSWANQVILLHEAVERCEARLNQFEALSATPNSINIVSKTTSQSGQPSMSLVR
ncbi:MAG: hypothetical protein V4525_11730 [Pseudomonadota bacterium]